MKPYQPFIGTVLMYLCCVYPVIYPKPAPVLTRWSRVITGSVSSSMVVQGYHNYQGSSGEIRETKVSVYIEGGTEDDGAVGSERPRTQADNAEFGGSSAWCVSA